MISKPEIIKLAACHKCAARPGHPCIFTREEDPRGLRANAMQSHLDRIKRARKIQNETKKSENKVKKLIDTIKL